MAIISDFSIDPSKLLSTSLRGTGSIGSFFGRVNNIIADTVYGSGKDFLQRYENFEKTYQRMLVKELDPSKAKGVDIEYLLKGGGIDLSILNKEAKKRLETMYTQDILRLPKLFRETGSPGIQLPSANKYRYAFKYGVDTDERIS